MRGNSCRHFCSGPLQRLCQTGWFQSHKSWGRKMPKIPWPPKQLPLSTSRNWDHWCVWQVHYPFLSGLAKKLVDVSGDPREHHWPLCPPLATPMLPSLAILIKARSHNLPCVTAIQWGPEVWKDQFRFTVKLFAAGNTVNYHSHHYLQSNSTNVSRTSERDNFKLHDLKPAFAIQNLLV